jgi:bifunctional UDP-N-acetylglucosamine pyrophosphorylase/glucosamine-1-phosphate N-acetyltransferase
MAAGVTIEDPATTYVDRSVAIAADTILHPCVSLEGRTTIGAGCEIHSGARIVDSRIGDRVTILNHCVITGATIGNDVSVGPFAHLRPEADLRDRARVGNFVELKHTVLGAGSKAMHLAYLGDATIGEKVNVGAGTITCNYDGVHKHTTTLGPGVFVGSDTQLVAPVTLGEGAYVAAGTTVTDDVPPGALAISRVRQLNLEGWVARRKKTTAGRGSTHS